jgi:hypothetical protein
MVTQDFRDEIPRRAFIDAQILQLAAASGELRGSIDAISVPYGLDRYLPLGPAYAAGLLYCLIVVPRELWWSPELLSRLEAQNPLALFSIKVASASTDVERLIRHLRNSVAHADFSIAHNGTFTFRDRRSRTGDPHFIAEIELPQLQLFLTAVGAEMANAGDRSPNSSLQRTLPAHSRGQRR